MDWETVITTLGSTGIGAGALAWLSKKLTGLILEKDIERFKASLQLESQKQVIQFGALHARRAEIIAEFYDKLTEVQNLSQTLPWNLVLREYKKDYGQELHGLEPEEEEDIKKLSTAWREMSEFYRKRKLYFTAPVCEQIERFQAITGFVSANYHNVAFKDEHGNTYVSLEVKQIWDASYEALPKAMAQLETEFRTLLSVT
jgi:hypothetical protein